MRVRIGIRNHLDRRHAYLDPQLRQLEHREIDKIRPLCHADPANVGLMHMCDMVNRFPLQHLGGEFVACLGCRNWLETHPHIVVCRNDLIVCDEHNVVVANRGGLPLEVITVDDSDRDDLPSPRRPQRRIGGRHLLPIP
ncbi:hypothetical protein CFP75_40120 [Amycolatopsis alba DSM 44262]|uniref:Uncharacterized protein n=2 Tax=Amycolatopsis alba TaxID=76020 RepID=A0A229R8Q8_AMYAL|nr:hypothetical protein CFP75_40120 [Amycolatopsis alba DSM 44262]